CFLNLAGQIIWRADLIRARKTRYLAISLHIPSSLQCGPDHARGPGSASGVYCMSKRQTGLAILGACLLACSIGLAADPGVADPVQGQAAAAVCASCHQADGSGMNIPGAESWPRLAGLDATYLAKQIEDFKSGQRSSPTMQAFAQMLTDEQIPHVAAWFASLPAPSLSSAEPYSPELLERGRLLATEGDWDNFLVPCSSCHGPDNL